MAYENYLNNTHAEFNKMNPFYKENDSARTSKEMIVIVSTTDTAIMEKITDRIKMLADDGFMFGRRICSTFFFRSAKSASYIRDKLMEGCNSADIIVLEATTTNYAAFVSPTTTNSIKEYFSVK